MNLLIVGAGTMGQWLGTAVQSVFDEIAFIDEQKAVAREAADNVNARAIDHRPGERFSAVGVAVPIPTVEVAIETHVEFAETAIFDVAGVMNPPASAMAEHAPELEHISLHPLFAPDSEPGRIAVNSAAPGPVTTRVLAVLAERGNTLIETTPEEHDDAMTTIQGAVHAALFSYALAVDRVPAELHTPLSETMVELARRLTAGDPDVYADIQATFGGASLVATAANQFAKTCKDIHPVANGDCHEGLASRNSNAGEIDGRQAFAELYREARKNVE